ncbi:hypothetical protein FJ955_02040 [Mesorhizobium sp. B2-2-2]|uniref:DotA/TraY family protein n=1 Tax=Mesorhizobium sp. B2-2-2 TaxID=2589964 RepID=UPI00112D7DD9|nr:DotA/TraY family protein [Mesorhizobium sp. B2-2-2]TPM33552.1 hypothetical protein FJ955_02040 [Mesorhizobium sp. B2-2-2]
MGPYDLLKEPAPTDVLWQWVNLILPENMDSAYGHALATFSASMAVVASLFVGFHIVVGIVSTAYSGKVLGDRFHQIWAPLRVILGFGMLVPIAGGFSSVHHGLRNIVAPIAINLGNAPIVSYVHDVAGEERKPITPYRTGGSRLAVDILEHEICLAIYNEQARAWLPQQPSPDAAGQEKGWGIIGNPVIVWDYGPKCGSFSFEKISGRESFSNSRMLAVADMIGAMRAEAAAYGKFFSQHNVELTTEQTEKAIQNGALPQLIQKLHEIGGRYDEAVIAAAHFETKDLVSDASAKMVETIEKEGLMRGGDMYLALAQTSYLSTSLTNEEPERVAPRIEDIAKNENVKSAIRAGIDSLKNQVAGETQWAGLTGNDLAAAGDESGWTISKIIGPMTRGFMEGIRNQEPTDNAISDIVNSGQWLKFSAKAAIGVGIIAEGAANNIVTKNLGAGGAVGYVLEWAGWGIMLTYILGVIRADLFPLVPAMLVLLMGANWIKSVLEATIATVLWAFVFIRMDGQDLVDQKQKAGVTMLLNLWLRPCLSMLALIASYPLFNGIYSHLNRTLTTAYLGVTGGSIVSIDNYLILLTIETFLTWTIATNLFGYIGSMSDRIYPWMGEQVPAGQEGTDAAAMAVGAAALANQKPNFQPRPKQEKPNPNGESGGGNRPDVGGVTSRSVK